jgi:uncharacterized protein (TIGR02246 family)
MPLTAADRIEILELAARYNHAIDHREGEAWANVFTDDGQLITDGTVRAAGREGLLAHIARAQASGQKVRHWICNAVVEGGGDQARLKMYVLAYVFTDGNITPTIMGEYDDDLVRQDGRWKFRTRRVTACAGGYPAHYGR